MTVFLENLKRLPKTIKILSKGGNYCQIWSGLISESYFGYKSVFVFAVVVVPAVHARHLVPRRIRSLRPLEAVLHVHVREVDVVLARPNRLKFYFAIANSTST